MTSFQMTLCRLKALKQQARLVIPHANPTHRMEIVARFLGWRTHASLLHDLRCEGRFIDEFDFRGAIDFSRKVNVVLGEEDLDELAERLQAEFGADSDYSLC